MRGALIEAEDSADVLEKAEVGFFYQPDYYFRDLNQTAEEAAALSLEKEGAVSEILESDGKFVLILRVEDNYENLKNYQIGTLLDRYRESRLAPMIRETAKTMSISWNDRGAELILKSID